MSLFDGGEEEERVSGSESHSGHGVRGVALGGQDWQWCNLSCGRMPSRGYILPLTHLITVKEAEPSWRRPTAIEDS